MKDFLSKCDQIRRKLRIWSHLLKKSFMENFIFGAVILEVKFGNDPFRINNISNFPPLGV